MDLFELLRTNMKIGPINLILLVLIKLTNSLLCPNDVTTATTTITKTNKRKICPDFKDNINEEYCCPSQVVPGSYYCCTFEHLKQLQDIQTAQLRKLFFKK